MWLLKYCTLLCTAEDSLKVPGGICNGHFHVVMVYVYCAFMRALLTYALRLVSAHAPGRARAKRGMFRHVVVILPCELNKPMFSFLL